VIFKDLNLHLPLLSAIDELGYVNPTPIQAKAFSAIMSGKDVIGIAQTGTGKTIAYLLPLLRQLKYADQKNPRILIVVPTRELVAQVVDEIEKLTKYMNVRFAGVYGATNINTQKQMIYEGLDILVATPGRLMDLYMTGILRLKSIQKFVIDEVDEMLNEGFRAQLISMMEVLPKKRQNLMFSATLTSEVEELVNEFFYDPQKIEIARHGTPLEQIEQTAFQVPNFYSKLNLLEYLLKENKDMEKVLVFVETKKMADSVFEKLDQKMPGICGVMHSNKSQNFRFNVLDKFENANIKVLIATDIIARGLDISDVSHVINFDTPSIQGNYIHRIGRTGRADKPGQAILFFNDVEQKYLAVIEQLMKKSIPISPLPENLEISAIYTDEERPDLGNKEYLKQPKLKHSKGAFHDKKLKNTKQNSGSPAKKNPKIRKKPRR
jgi:ATP-dependent RNA helicase RhlE